MTPRIPQSKLAFILAVIFTGFGVFMVVIAPLGGFETQTAWLLLLPGQLIVDPVSDLVFKHAPHLEGVVFWTVTIVLNFLWYWWLSSIVIRIHRRFSGF